MVSVLVSGAGVAGTTVAYWLAHQGCSVTVVERSAGLRPGGQAVGVRGPALTVLERMRLRAAADHLRTRIRGSSVVDRDGIEQSRDTESAPPSPDIELLRDDLVELLYESTKLKAEFLFGDGIATIDDDGTAVEVTFESADPRAFDLVVGADGLHSTVRRLVFGPEEQFIERLGMYAAIFTVPNFLNLDRWQTWNYGESGMAGVYSARDNSEVRAMLGFMDADLRIDYRDTAAQFAELERRMAGDGWVRPQLLQYMRTAPDFYFDEMSQIKMDHWAKGRVVLVGDAGYCCSPLSGQGTSVALLGAYILAGELAACGGDYDKGFGNYQKEFADYVKRNQWLVVDNIPGGAPIPQEVFDRIVNSIALKDY
ncbi:FAD-binding protein [Mycobacterium helveticum]|uniref:FAD-binding protein n=1 Tax=Mycobacterium helveticum TaxID=2592811 RepID=A0A557Y0C3_9MYCO|nr:FAD-binding protein [Mycobacterium helveticum]TVS88527.1 FAD-binding protein [Mycobacterium helveticum]TVS91986.1 FAD-binding protein [Mycobacterium helveticum]